MKNNSKKTQLFLLDTMVLINLAERCESMDLFEDFRKINVCFQIVEEVEKEFKKGIKPIGRERLTKHKKDGMIKVIPDDDIELDETKMTYFLNQQFGKGELFSSLYFITQDNINFVSDEKRVHKVFDNKLRVKVSRTDDLLNLLIKKKLITASQKKEILKELIKNGFWFKNKEV